jgi:hypothetical protein
MLKLFVAAVLLTGLVTSIARADGCVTIERAVQTFEQTEGVTHFLLRSDDVVQKFAALYDGTPGGEVLAFKPEFILVATSEATDRAWVFYGHGGKVCNFLGMRASVLRLYLTKA